MKPGDVIGGRFEITRGPVAIQGLEGCTDMCCTRWVSRETGEDVGCAGYHCPDCLERTGMTGHQCPKRTESEPKANQEA